MRERDAVDAVLGFARTLRAAGVAASPDRVEAMLTAVGVLDVLDPTDVLVGRHPARHLGRIEGPLGEGG